MLYTRTTPRDALLARVHRLCHLKELLLSLTRTTLTQIHAHSHTQQVVFSITRTFRLRPCNFAESFSKCLRASSLLTKTRKSEGHVQCVCESSCACDLETYVCLCVFPTLQHYLQLAKFPVCCKGMVRRMRANACGSTFSIAF